MKNQHVISIDIETTGLNPETCQVLEVGLVYADLSLPELDTSQQLRIVLNLELIQGEPYAICLNYELLKEIRDLPNSAKEDTTYIPSNLVNAHINNWLDTIPQIKGVSKLNIAGKNFAGFDRPFLEKLGVSFKRFSHKILDPAMLYWDIQNDVNLPGLDQCLQRAGINKVVTHTAVEDAIDVLKVLHHHIHK